MKKIIGIMGPGSKATTNDLRNAYEIGKWCALNNFVVLTGGRNEGVMNEALKGSKEAGGLTVGILPSDDRDIFSEYIDIPIITNMRSGRNYINVLSSDLIVVCGIDGGTSSEISLAINPGKKIVMVGLDKESNDFFKKLADDQIFVVDDFSKAIDIIQTLI